MSSGPRKRFLREMKKKLAEQGIFKKRAEDPMAFQQLSEEEARRQVICNVIAALALILLFLCLPISF